MRVATIDIGTNTVLLLVADQIADGTLVAVTERATITRLGERVSQTARLAPAAIARTRTCLEGYARTVQQLGVNRVAVVGTSAMRDAEGGEEIKTFVRATLGVDIRVVTGQEEARLTFRGALSGLGPRSRERCAVFDIGGGSTEVVLGQVEGRAVRLEYAASFELGSVRFTERFISRDPPSPTELDALLRAAREALSVVPRPNWLESPIGVAGTMTTLAAVSLGLAPYDGGQVHGRSLSRDELRRVVLWLAGLSLPARSSVAGMEPARADVIVAGGSIALALLDHWDAESVVISDRGVRWGLAQELVETRGI